jgi:glutamine synthetase
MRADITVMSCAAVHQLTTPGQWAYTLGPCVGIQAGDELQMSRFILQRLTEDYEYIVSLDPNPCPDFCEPLGAPVKYCTSETTCRVRGPAAIQEHIARLEV